MSKAGLLESIFRLSSFQQHLTEVVKASVLQDLPGVKLDPQPELTPPIDWKYLLSCASLLSQSKESEHQDAALRIAQAGLHLQSDETGVIQVGCATIFDSLTNNPALDLSIRRNLIPANYRSQLPAPLKLDLLKRRFETGIQTSRELVNFTRFQAEVFRGASNNDWISISAPTSAGKSFVLNRIIAQKLDDSDSSNIAYIVPTRALIQQVLADLTEINAKHQRTNVLITTMPQVPADRTAKCIFVVTQERMHWLLSQVPENYSIDLLVVDEAHKIGDGARGILLQQVIETAARRFPRLRTLFSSPLTSNPELLVEDVPHNSQTKYLSSEQPTVNQNLIWVSQDRGDLRQWSASLCTNSELKKLGTIALPESPSPESKRLPFVAFAMTESARDGGCLLYVDTQSKAEKAAFQLAQLRKEDVSGDVEIVELTKLIKKIVHPSYLLVDTLPKGVAFHYGNMPLILRTEIERLFKKGKIRFLVCTSTLIEGVNLPAKYIFVRGPRKGTKDPLTAADFWNLAGRAGRLGTEFQGSVICVDPTLNVWKEPPPTKRANYPIKRALDNVLVTHDKFIEFLDAEHVDRSPQRLSEYEHALVYCSQVLLRGETLTGHAWSKRFSAEVLSAVEAKVRSTIEGITVLPEIIQRNAGVSPVAQQRLLNYFRAYDETLDRLVPYPPDDPKAVEDSYLRLIGNLSKYLSGDTFALTYPRAILVVNWMRGHPLKRIIDANIAYWVPKGREIPKIIRDTMEDVEQYARFSFVKFVSCYLDVLKQHLSEKGRIDLINRIPQLQLYAEFGASQKTQMALMDIGLSRVAAIELSEIIIDTSLDRNGCIDWLQKTNLSGLTLSPILVREIEIFKIGLRSEPGLLTS